MRPASIAVTPDAVVAKGDASTGDVARQPEGPSTGEGTPVIVSPDTTGGLWSTMNALEVRVATLPSWLSQATVATSASLLAPPPTDAHAGYSHTRHTTKTAT
jgi:hypothetical protein